MQIVKIGKHYAVRAYKTFDTWYYVDLKDPNNIWSKNSRYFKDCLTKDYYKAKKVLTYRDEKMRPSLKYRNPKSLS